MRAGWGARGYGEHGRNVPDHPLHRMCARYILYNFLLISPLPSQFSASGHSFGLTFTAPSSYWYLQHFDLLGLLTYADWVNLMSYDLHGVWDAKDVFIGNIVQAHTNLTEIEQSVGLFQRVGVPLDRIVLGLGFYGRSFQLSDPSCSTPGCPFNGPAPGGRAFSHP